MKSAVGIFVGSMLYLVAGAALAQSTMGPAAEITVRVDSIHVVRSISIIPGNATMRLCPRCESSSVPSLLQVSVAEGSKQLTVGSKKVQQLELTGELRLTTSNGLTSMGAGRWSIRGARDGMHILLTMPIERYVMDVLSSEASADEPPESLKALAVTVRSFALMYPHRHGLEGLCDSTHCEALRVGPATARIEEAVNATAGETLWWRGARVPAYFTQSCGGVSEDAAELWGGASRSWLISRPDSFCQRQPSQWRLQIGEGELRSALAAEGWRMPDAIEAVHVLDRAASGRVRRLSFVSQQKSVTISAASLRFAVDRSLGWNQIRSDWYEIHYAQGQIFFDGKGHGHGVGLCQAGASEMAAQGKDYRSILAAYFPGTAVRILREDEGWRQSHGRGWKLRSTDDSAEFLAEGNRAFARAQVAWPLRASVPPIVTVYPATELFRQVANEPGWALAATRGNEIAVQPALIVERHERVEELLLHEFLHSRIEQEASEQAPLWLREGLVEVLAGGIFLKVTAMDAEHIERSLRSANSLEEAALAHRAAGALVAHLAATRGLDTLRGWLRKGVPRGAVQ